jgi:hypothetical protein
MATLSAGIPEKLSGWTFILEQQKLLKIIPKQQKVLRMGPPVGKLLHSTPSASICFSTFYCG